MFDWQTILTVVAITGAISFVGLRAWQRIRSMRSRGSCVSDCHGCDAILNRDLLHHTALPLDVRRWLRPANTSQHHLAVPLVGLCPKSSGQEAE